jgi:hypothetical protein
MDILLGTAGVWLNDIDILLDPTDIWPRVAEVWSSSTTAFLNASLITKNSAL